MIKLHVKALIVLNTVLMGSYSVMNAASNKRYFLESGIEAKSIFMKMGDSIQMTPAGDDRESRSIFSFGFRSCAGVGLYMLLKNQEQRAALTHYHPLDTDEHCSKILELSKKLKAGIGFGEVVKVVGIIFYEGDGEEEIKTWSTFGLETPMLLNRLTQAITGELCGLGCEVRIVQQEYNRLAEIYSPTGMYNGSKVPKEFELVLSPNPSASHFHTKVTFPEKQKFSDLAPFSLRDK